MVSVKKYLSELILKSPYVNKLSYIPNPSRNDYIDVFIQIGGVKFRLYIRNDMVDDDIIKHIDILFKNKDRIKHHIDIEYDEVFTVPPEFALEFSGNKYNFDVAEGDIVFNNLLKDPEIFYLFLNYGYKRYNKKHVLLNKNYVPYLDIIKAPGKSLSGYNTIKIIATHPDYSVKIDTNRLIKLTHNYSFVCYEHRAIVHFSFYHKLVFENDVHGTDVTEFINAVEENKVKEAMKIDSGRLVGNISNPIEDVKTYYHMKNIEKRL